MFRAIVFFGLITAAFAGESLDPLVNASTSYADAKTKYFKALRDAAPESMKIAMGREARPPELDTMAAAFVVAGEKQETVADEETIALLKRFAGNPDVEKARAEFDRAQRVEESFHRDFDGQLLH
jgi:hypothetical protein